MGKIEQLTDEDLTVLRKLAEGASDADKALLARVVVVVESQAGAIEAARRVLQTPSPVNSPDALLTRELWEILGTNAV